MYREPRGRVEMMKQSAERATERRRRHCDHIDQKKRKTPGFEPVNGFPCSPMYFLRKDEPRARDIAICMYLCKRSNCHIVQSHARYISILLASQLALNRVRCQLGPNIGIHYDFRTWLAVAPYADDEVSIPTWYYCGPGEILSGLLTFGTASALGGRHEGVLCLCTEAYSTRQTFAETRMVTTLTTTGRFSNVVLTQDLDKLRREYRYICFCQEWLLLLG